MPHASHTRRRLDRPSRRQASDDWPGRGVVDLAHPNSQGDLPMLRSNILLRPLLAALMVVAILAPAAIADPNPPSKAPTFWSYDYQAPMPHPRAAHAVKTTDTDTPWAAIAVTLAGVTVLLGAATVLPRRPQRVAT
jgi:hypothetical protein